MIKLIRNQQIFRHNMMAVIGICLSFYFCYHLIAGQRGYFRLVSLESQVKSLAVRHDSLKSEREHLEKRVVMMRPGSIDRDLLEERSRHVLGYRHADELIMLQSR